MLVFPNAKINLGLNVVTRRSDGYHAIESVFYPIQLTDAMEFVEAKNSNKDRFLASGLPIPGGASDNLCLKAISLLRKKHAIPPLDIYLHKVVPMGAGLGGGSSDGAFLLNALNTAFDLGMHVDELEEQALQLGSDCPFFIENKPVAVSGRGEVMRQIQVDLSGFYLGLVFSDLHISTADAYENLKPKKPNFLPADIIQNESLGAWKDQLTNDFEGYAFAKYPELKRTRQKLYGAGALYVSMTGTGSAVYGIFKSRPDLIDIGLSRQKCWSGEL